MANTYIRMFRKMNGVLTDFTKSKATQTTKPAIKDTAAPDTKAKAIASESPKTKKFVLNEARTNKLMATVDALIESSKKSMASSEAAGNTTTVKPVETTKGNGDPVVYYMMKHQYYIMWFRNKIWIRTVTNPYWCWVTKQQMKNQNAIGFGQSSPNPQGDWVDATIDEFEDILRSKYSLSDLRMKYHIYMPNKWNFKEGKEWNEYMKLNRYNDYNAAVKI